MDEETEKIASDFYHRFVELNGRDPFPEEEKELLVQAAKHRHKELVNDQYILYLLWIHEWKGRSR